MIYNSLLCIVILALPGLSNENLRSLAERARTGGLKSIQGSPVFSHNTIYSFYLKRTFEPAWGLPDNKSAMELLASIESSRYQGLRPRDYHLVALNEIIQGGKSKKWSREEADFILTDTFLLFASDLLTGSVDPVKADKDWKVSRNEMNFAVYLEEALGKKSVGKSLDLLNPSSSEFNKLKSMYGEVLTLQKDLELQKGDNLDAGIIKKYKKPLAEVWKFRNSISAPSPNTNSKQSKGPIADNPDTLESATTTDINKNTQLLLENLEVNLQRWRWLPRDLGKNYILVNLADFHLRYIRSDSSVLKLKTIVGKKFRETPVFTEKLQYVVINPRWHVPNSIAVNDKLPLIKKDPGYLAKNGYTMYDKAGGMKTKVDPGSIPWAEINSKHFPYQLEQKSGSNNALGFFKFMFPNRFNVYIHDTPDRHLFDREVRTFSSGCIRVQNPEELAWAVLQGKNLTDRKNLSDLVKSGTETTFFPNREINVHILYLTAFLSDQAKLEFRPDIYGRDKKIAGALKQKYP